MTVSNRGSVPFPDTRNAHGLWAKTTRKVVTHALPTFRVECTCGWESGWNYDWPKSLDGHIRREQRKTGR